MDRFGDWLWRRYRAHFVHATAVVLIGLTQPFITAPTAIAVGLFLGAGAIQIAQFTAVAIALQLVSGGVIAWWNVRSLLPLTRWARLQSTDTEAAWQAAMGMPHTIAHHTVPFMTMTDHLIIIPVGVRMLDISSTEHIAVQGTVVVIEVAVVLIVSVISHLLYQAPLRELSPLIPLDAEPITREWSLRFRLTLGVVVTGMTAAFTTAMTVRSTESTAEAMALSSLVGAAITGYLAFLVYVGIVRASLAPLSELVAATRRVQRGDYSDRLEVTSADEIGDVAIAFNQMQKGLLERASLQQAFGSYVDPSLAQRLLEQGDSVFAGEDVAVTVFFADVRGFTTYASAAPATDAVARLNRLFELIVPIIRDHGGHANTYLGDGVLAVFGTPEPLANHADEAVAAAVDIQRAVFDEFGESLRIGVGVNTGAVIAGTIGGGGKLEFTVIGDTVNVASRVEALTKETGDPILLTQATVDALSVVPASLVDRGMFEVRGKDQKVQLHGLRP